MSDTSNGPLGTVARIERDPEALRLTWSPGLDVVSVRLDVAAMRRRAMIRKANAT